MKSLEPLVHSAYSLPCLNTALKVSVNDSDFEPWDKVFHWELNQDLLVKFQVRKLFKVLTFTSNHLHKLRVSQNILIWLRCLRLSNKVLIIPFKAVSKQGRLSADWTSSSRVFSDHKRRPTTVFGYGWTIWLVKTRLFSYF